VNNKVAIFEYKCPICGKIEEFIHPHDKLEKPLCPVCCYASKKSAVVMERILSLPAEPIFKGSGWYATEYGKQKHNKDKDEDKEKVDVKKDSE